MSTNAAIGLAMPDGTIKAVYLHWDGYITDGGAGETLAEHYKDRGFYMNMNVYTEEQPDSCLILELVLFKTYLFKLPLNV